MDTIEIKGHTATVNGKLVWIPKHERHIEHAVDDDFAALVQHHDVKPISLPKPPAPEPPQTTFVWQPQAKDIGTTYQLVNTNEGHNKAYKVAVVHMPDGTWGVVAQWGKIGGTMAQQVKHPGLKNLSMAQAFAQGLAGEKHKKGYVKDYSHALVSLSPIPLKAENAKATEAPPTPAAAPVPAVAPEKKAAPTVETPTIGHPVDADFASLVESLGVKPLQAKPEPVAAQPEPKSEGPVAITTKTAANSTVTYEGAGGKAVVTWKMSGMKVNLRVKFKEGEGIDGAAEALAGIGAKWMPNAKEWSFDLPGKPWAGGKPMAQAVHDVLHKHIGAPKHTPYGKPAVFEEMAVGMKITKHGTVPTGSARAGEVVAASSAEVEIKWAMPSGHDVIGTMTKPAFDKMVETYGVIVSSGGPAVGDTKVEGGHTYILNKNHRWELVIEAGAAKAQSVANIKAIWNKMKPGELKTLNNGIVIEKSKPNGTILRIHKVKSNGSALKQSEMQTLLKAGGASNVQNKVVFIKGYVDQGISAIAGLTGYQASATPKAPEQAVSGAVKVFKKGETVGWADLKPGMKFYAEAPNSSYEIKTKIGGSISATVKELSYPKEPAYLGTYDEGEWIEFMGDSLVLTEDFESKAKVGDTKVENGKTYVLNANHKWELQQTTYIEPIKVGETFPFKQIGPQKGSNPGGLYEDNYGKKWYIKFPATEDHAKNELLASKLYALLGVPGPKLKLVKKDGKVGIASLFQEGLENTTGKKLASKREAIAGFGADAWLSNWDAVGLSFDNMPVGKDGKAVRIDVGGSLLYRAQGAPKGDAFSTTVPEIETLRDKTLNPQTAAVFGAMTQAEIEKSMVPVLEVPDETIREAVDKFGPGTPAEKKKLADTLIARKKYLAAKYPAANLIANPPKPDPTKLKVDPGVLPKLLDFMNWNGAGKGLSSTEKVNAVNQAAVQEVYTMALQGNLTALKDIKIHIVDKATGETTVGPIAQHPSQHVKNYWNECVSFMEVLANPGAKKLKSYDLEEVSDIAELSDMFPSKPYGANPGNINPKEVMGYFMNIGAVADPMSLKPKNAGRHVTATETAQAKEKYKTLPKIVKNYIEHVQASGGINHYFKGDSEKYGGVNIKEALVELYKHASPKPAGTTIYRWMKMPDSMVKQLEQAQEGLVFQNTDSMCASKKPGWDSSPNFGSHLLTIHYAEGAKATDSFASGEFSGEQEITTLPGQRFVLLKKGKAPGGGIHLELLMLPPDPTFIDSVVAGKKVA